MNNQKVESVKIGNVNLVAKQIESISKSVRELKDGGLNERALLTLIHESSKVSKSAIKKTLEAMAALDRTYLSKYDKIEKK